MKRIGVILILLSLLISISVIPTDATEKKERVVTIAYPIQDGLTEIDEDNIYSGYTYEYLKEISRFTNWKLEFVQFTGDINEQILTAMDKVKTGEIDLMGGLVYSDTLINDYDYSATNYGMGNMAIYVNSDNAEINDTNIYSLKNLDVGIVSTKKEVNVSLKDFGDINGININQLFYDNSSDLQKALENDELDAMILSDLSIPDGDYRVVARFSPRPFYFVTTKGNSQLMSELNEAMTMLNKEQPNYMSNLHEKYFSMANNDFILTAAEKQFIKNNPEIDVLITGGKAPLQYYSDKKREVAGITIDVLDYIGELSGLKFNYIYADNNNEYENLLIENEPMIIGGVTNSNIKNYSTTKVYFNSGISLVTNKGIDIGNLKNKKIALLREAQLDNIAITEENTRISYFDTLLDCIKAVDNGDADYTYMNNHVALFYNSSYSFDDINIIPQENQRTQGIYFAISDKTSYDLMNIMNKGIDAISNNQLEDIVFTNANAIESNVTFFDYFESNQIQVIATVIILILIIALILLIWRSFINKRNNKIIFNEYYRYQQISEFSHDCFIEYNVNTDTLVLMGGGAKLLSDKLIIHNYLEQSMSGQELLAHTLKTLKAYEEERFVKFVDGTKRWLKINLRPVFNDVNKVTHIIGKAIDIQSEKEEQLLWRDLARKDSLTKIYNSAACREEVEKFLKENDNDMVALIIIDVDNFKEINDTYGHLCGDVVLRKIVQSLIAVSHPLDIFGRVGGDEFLVLFKHPDSIKRVEEYCQNMIKAVSKVRYQNEYIETSISVGAVVSRNKTTYDDLYKLADKALYDVKKSGRNNYLVIGNEK